MDIFYCRAVAELDMIIHVDLLTIITLLNFHLEKK